MMKRKGIGFLLALAFLATSAYLLVTASGWLVTPLFGNENFPMGTLITWTGFIALQATVFFGADMLIDPDSKWEKTLRYGLLALIVLGMLWGFIAFLLAGNWGFNFSAGESFRGGPQASRIFWGFNYALAAAPWVLLLLLGVIKTVKMIVKK